MKKQRPSARVKAALSIERLKDRPIEAVPVMFRRADIHGIPTTVTISMPRVRFLERDDGHDVR